MERKMSDAGTQKTFDELVLDELRAPYREFLSRIARSEERSLVRVIESALANYQLITSGHSKLVETNPQPKMAPMPIEETTC
jgi:hypothetical protein